jgi:murein L,D-transpeptidase YcbB/YkuD
MNIDATVRLVEALAWPLTLLTIVILLRHEMSAAIGRLKGLEGPAGLKLQFEVVRDSLANLTNLTKLATNIYSLTGEPLQVREEIYTYLAEILNRVSPETALEMKKELNKYHLSRLDLDTVQVKAILKVLHFYDHGGSEKDEFSSEVDLPFIEAVRKYQQSKHMRDADGVVGPKTLKHLHEDMAERAQPAARADG